MEFVAKNGNNTNVYKGEYFQLKMIRTFYHFKSMFSTKYWANIVTTQTATTQG
jgi:hypothetical protein